MKCPTCGKQTKGVDHNQRGLRCTSCWALLPDEPPKPAQRRKRAAKTKANSEASEE